MTLRELLEVIPMSTKIIVIHAVLNTIIPECDYSPDWMVFSVNAIKKNTIRISVI